jgi:hypothetical protein
MAYVSPGGAFSTSFGAAIDQDNANRRQAMLDALHVKQVEAQIAEGQAALEEKKQEHRDKIEEQERKDTISDVGAMAIGDIPDADLVARAKKYHVPMRTETTGGPVPAAEQIPQQFGQTATDLAAPKPVTRFLGSPKDADAKRKQDRLDQIITQVPDLDPASPEFKRAAIEYEMISGKSLPSALFTSKTAADTTAAVMRDSPTTGSVERLMGTDAKGKAIWAPWSGDAPKGAHWITQKDTSAGDAAREARKGAQIQSLHEAAIRELDGWSKQAQGEAQELRKLGPMLNSPTPITDRLVSPEILKLIVAGQGSGFRMTRDEINNVTHGRSRWEDLDNAVLQWTTDPSKALILSPTQREDLKNLVAAVKKEEAKVAHQVIDARTEYDDAMIAGDSARINKARTKLQKQFLDLGDEGDAGSSGGSSSGRTEYVMKNGKLVPKESK